MKEAMRALSQQVDFEKAVGEQKQLQIDELKVEIEGLKKEVVAKKQALENRDEEVVQLRVSLKE